MRTLLTTNSIWIVENNKQYETLERLRSKLRYKKVVRAEQCELHTLPEYDMVFFLLLPTQIGHRFFIDAIEEILHYRKNSKTIFLAIDESYRLEEQERVEIMLELKASISHLVPNPTVFFVSSLFATIHSEYELGQISLEDVRQNRDVMISVKGEGLLMGRQLQENHIPMLLEISKMDKVYGLVEEFAEGVKRTGVDVSKENWLVLGPPGMGKSTVIRSLQSNANKPDYITFVNETPVTSDDKRYYDKLIIVLDLDSNKWMSYLEDLCSVYVGLDKMIFVNKCDEFMFYGKSRQQLQSEIDLKLRKLTSDPIFFVSAYYYEQYHLLQSGQITEQDIIENPEIVLTDSLDFPIIKEKNRSVLSELLQTQSGFHTLLHIWE